MSNLYLDFHVLQSIGPANINRDDSGSPKSTVFGGVRRARVSSQAWKRAIRREFADTLDPQDLSERTLLVVDRIMQKITDKAPELEDVAQQLAIDVMTAAGEKITQPKKAKDGEDVQLKPKTDYLLFVSKKQIAALAELAIAAHNEGESINKKAAKQALNDDTSIEVALFGRMLANAADLNVDAACQVAHSIGVHPLENEFDYFTAVDDNAPADNPGAGMIGTVEFNSSTLYRYATINVGALVESLGSVAAAAKAVEHFTRAFAVSMPTGKQNTFANRTRPEFFAVSVRDDQPVSFVEAFETAIRSTTGVMAEATNRLVKHAIASDEAYGATPRTYFLATGNAAQADVEGFGEQHTLPELIDIAARTVSDTSAEES